MEDKGNSRIWQEIRVKVMQVLRMADDVPPEAASKIPAVALDSIALALSALLMERTPNSCPIWMSHSNWNGQPHLGRD